MTKPTITLRCLAARRAQPMLGCAAQWHQRAVRVARSRGGVFRVKRRLRQPMDQKEQKIVRNRQDEVAESLYDVANETVSLLLMS